VVRQPINVPNNKLGKTPGFWPLITHDLFCSVEIGSESDIVDSARTELLLLLLLLLYYTPTWPHGHPVLLP
jgi:hypothetical protein